MRIKQFIQMLANRQGSVMNIALLILMLLTLLGITFANLSSTDLRITANERTQSLSFYAAEAARSYVEGTPALYGSTNVTPGLGVTFPDKNDPAATQALGAKQSFSGTVTYVGAEEAGRGRIPPSAHGLFKEHEYVMTCDGNGPPGTSAQTQVQAGFYRVGF